MASLDDLYFTSGVTVQQKYPTIEAYATQFAKQIKPACAIIFDGNPLIPQSPANDGRLEFQKKWLNTPLTNHTINSFDCHLVPGTGLFTISTSGKVRFDESGRSRLGETADIISQNDMSSKPRVNYGPWFGFTLYMVVDEAIVQNNDFEAINTFNYRITYAPEDSMICI